MNTFPRLFTAMVTPFKEDLSIDFDAAQRLALKLVNEGSGLVVCGTTGESPTLSIKEKIDLFKAVKEAVGEKGTVLAGTGTNSTSDCIEMTQAACKLGVDGVMVVVPYYNKPNQEGLYQHFKAVAAESSLPILLYNVPGRTGINMLPDTVKRLAGISNIVGIKEACGDMDQVSLLRSILPKDFLIYSGDDSITLPMMALGCFGVISVASNIAAKEINQMLKAFTAGKTEEALQIHLRLFDLFRAMFLTTNPIPVKKAVSLTGMCSDKLRLPMVEADSKQEKVISNVLKDLSLI